MPDPNPLDPLQKLYDQMVREDAGRRAGETPGAQQPPFDVGAAFRGMIELEMRALELARTELRAEGMVPWTPAGLLLWLPLAKQISQHLRGRLGMTIDPPEAK